MSRIFLGSYRFFRETQLFTKSSTPKAMVEADLAKPRARVEKCGRWWRAWREIDICTQWGMKALRINCASRLRQRPVQARIQLEFSGCTSPARSRVEPVSKRSVECSCISTKAPIHGNLEGADEARRKDDVRLHAERAREQGTSVSRRFARQIKS